MSSPAAVAAHLHAIKHRGEQEYPKQVWYIVLSVIAAGTIVNVISIIWREIQLRRPKPVPGSTKTIAERRFSLANVPAAVLTACRIVAFRWQLFFGWTYAMSVLEVFLTAAYLAALLVHEFVHTNNLDSDFWANRAAHIAAAQIPLLPALSAKNNIIGWLTGVGHEKLNIFHRIAARCILVLIWIHLWGRWQIGFTGVDDISMFNWQQCGLTAGTAYTLAIVLSMRPIRVVAYEFFYFSHVVLIFVFVLMSYLHTSEPGFGYYIWPTWVVWGFDRLCRAARYLFLNAGRVSTGTLSAAPPDALRLMLSPRGSWRAGQHAFLVLPGIAGVPVEAHPFTIASVPGKGEGEKEEDGRMVFLIRVRGGVTRRLLARASLENEKEAEAEKGGSGECAEVDVRVWVDGPYGCPTEVRAYDTCVLVAGGSGVSYTLPLVLDLIRNAKIGKARTQRVLFVWAVRDDAHIRWISDPLARALATLPSSSSVLDVDVRIYVTGPGASTDVAELAQQAEPSADATEVEDSTEKIHTHARSDDTGLGLAVATVHRGRPNVGALLEAEAARARAGSSMSVDVSGPSALIGAVRSALTKPFAGPPAVLRGAPAVRFHAECYTL